MKSGLIRTEVTACLIVVAFDFIGIPLRAQTAQAKKAGGIKKLAYTVPAVFKFPGWIPAGKVLKLQKEKLSDRFGAEAAIILEYGFIDLAVHRFKPSERTRKDSGKEIVLELLRMETPADAFGIFALRRSGVEKTSGLIGTSNGLGPTNAEFVKGNCYIRLLLKGCEEADVERIASAAARQVRLPVAVPPEGFVWLPKRDFVPGSERYIRGALAARKETPLLGKDFWGFGPGGCRAYSGRYSAKDSKLIILDFGRKADDLTEAVLSLFREYLENVRQEGDTVSGEDTAGFTFLFRQGERTAAMVLGEPDREAARARITEALAHAAKQG